MQKAISTFGVSVDTRSGMSRLAAVLYRWQQRMQEREHLGMLDERLLKDIGLTRLQALSEVRKPFWRA